MEHPGEVWQEFDRNGERLGGIDPANLDRDKVKFFGGAAIMLYRFRDGEVEFLFQHRSKHLLSDPDKWDVSAGGHINLDEQRIDTVVRESREEIGAQIEKDKLEFAGTYLGRKLFVSLYFYDWTGREDDFHFDDEEVEEVEWVKYSELDDSMLNFKQSLREDNIFTYSLKEWNTKILEKYGNL